MTTRKVSSKFKDWKLVHLGDSATFLKKLSLSRDQMTPGGEISYLHYGDIHVGPKYRLDARIERMPTIKLTDQANATLLAVGDLVFVDASEDTLGVGKSVEITDVPENGLVAGLHTIAVRFDKSVLADGFKAYLQEIPAFRAHMLRLAAGTKVLASTKSHIASAEILLPSTQEQLVVAGVLSSTDQLLDSLDALLAKKRDIKQGVMQQLLTGKTRLPEFHSQWQMVRLGDVVTMSSGGTPPSKVSEFYGGQIKWASIADMTKAGKYLSHTDVMLTKLGLVNSSAVVYKGPVILYAMYASIGEVCISPEPVSSSQAILGISTGNKIELEFLYYLLEAFKPTAKNLGQQGTQSNLNKGMVQDFTFKMPTQINEQQAISKVLSDMDSEIEALKSRREKTALIKIGMMQELLTGRTRLI